MKSNRKFNIVLAVLFVIVSLFVPCIAGAAGWYPLGAQEAALKDANYVAEISYTDLAAVTTTNTALTLTNAFNIASNSAVKFVSMNVVRAFDSGNTNYLSSTTLAIGDDSNATQFMATVECNTDSTNTWVAIPQVNKLVIQTGTPAATNGLVLPTVVTNVSMTAYNTKVYTANNHINFKFTPNAEEALSGLSNGMIRAYFMVFGRGTP